MHEVGTVVTDVLQELTNGPLGAQGAAVAMREVVQPREAALEPRAARQHQGLADELVERGADGRAAQGVRAGVRAGPPKPEQEVKVAELEDPAVLASDPPHPRQIVSHEATNAPLDGWRQDGHGAAPARGAFLAGQQQRIEEDSAVPPAGAQGGQVENPRAAGELEPEAIHQQQERARRQRLGGGPSDEATQGLADAIAVRAHGDAPALAGQLAHGEAADEDAVQDGERRSATFRTPAARTHSPGASARDALPTTGAEASDPNAATGGFRVHRGHAHELVG